MREYTRVYAEVNLDRIEENMKAMKDNLSPETRMMGVVKTDGYGHGAVPVAKALDPYVWGYAVATIDEGIILRRHGIAKPILILGVTHQNRFEELVRYEIRPAVFRYEEARLLSGTAEAMGRQTPVHLALDTGMSRIGMSPDEASAGLVERMSRLPGIRLEGLFTHFARADEKDKAAARVQYGRYMHFLELLRDRGISIPICHCGNSAGIIDLPELGLDMVRAGISIYGLYPSDEVDKKRVLLKPAMSLISFVTFVKTIEPGTSVSYGGTYTAGSRLRVATVPVGYGDGYPRGLSGKGQVLIRGRRADILGRVCMDQFMIDVTGIPEAEEGDRVILMGRDGEEDIQAEELADISGRYHYELLCDIGKRVPRVYMREGRAVGSKDYFEDVYNDFRLEK